MKLNLNTSTTSLLALLLLAIGPASVNAIVITGVTVEDFSSQLDASFDRRADYTLDGSGGVPHGEITGSHGTIPDGSMWLSTGSCCGGTPAVDPDVVAADGRLAHIVYDLGAEVDVSAFRVWNYNESAGGGLNERGINSVTITTSSTDNLAGLNTTAGTVLGTFNFAKTGEPVAADPGELFSVPFTARFVRLDVNSNHVGDNNFAGLSEIRFDGSYTGLIEGVTATASSELAGFNRPVGNIVDNVGLDTINPDGNPGQVQGMWLNQGTFGGNTSIHDLDPEVVFDLGAVELIGEMRVFNYNEATRGLSTRGVNDVEILVSNDGVNFTSLGDFNFAQAPSTLLYGGELFDLGNVSARFVKFDIGSNHGGDANFVGLNEVQFFRADVPEPTTAILSLLGLGGLLARRRRVA